jgi:ribosome-binding ATPase YchF (GTP1/OBG family)
VKLSHFTLAKTCSLAGQAGQAEVINYEDFVQCGSEQAAREKGVLRIEGRDYIVKDGDILHIRFNL